METKNLLQKAMVSYIKENAEQISETIELEIDEFELFILRSILNQKQKQLADMLKNIDGFEKVRVEVENEGYYNVIVYFEAAKYNQQYGNNSFLGRSIDQIGKEIIDFFKSNNKFNMC